MSKVAEGERIVTFRLGADLFAADIFAVERVLKYEVPRALPNMPDWIEGVIEYQDKIVPVIDLRRRFGMAPAEHGPHTRMLVISSGTEWIAAMVDGVLDVRPLHSSDFSDPPQLFRGLAGEYMRGLTRRDEHLVVVLNVDRLLSSRERLSFQPSAAGPHA